MPDTSEYQPHIPLNTNPIHPCTPTCSLFNLCIVAQPNPCPKCRERAPYIYIYIYTYICICIYMATPSTYTPESQPPKP